MRWYQCLVPTVCVRICARERSMMLVDVRQLPAASELQPLTAYDFHPRWPIGISTAEMDMGIIRYGAGAGGAQSLCLCM